MEETSNKRIRDEEEEKEEKEETSNKRICDGEEEREEKENVPYLPEAEAETTEAETPTDLETEVETEEEATVEEEKTVISSAIVLQEFARKIKLLKIPCQGAGCCGYMTYIKRCKYNNCPIRIHMLIAHHPELGMNEDLYCRKQYKSKNYCACTMFKKHYDDDGNWDGIGKTCADLVIHCSNINCSEVHHACMNLFCTATCPLRICEKGAYDKSNKMKSKDLPKTYFRDFRGHLGMNKWNHRFGYRIDELLAKKKKLIKKHMRR